ncbi:MAG: c-type cytochrome [Chloroflexota bacterium]
MPKRMLLGGIVGLVGLAWLGLAAFPSQAAAPLVADAAAGQTLYQQNCQSCHGADAKGGVKLGDATAADLRWDQIGPAYHQDPTLVARAITQGLDQDGKALDDVMPRWQGKLTAGQVQDLVGYLQTLTTAVPAQVVATPVHEDATPVPTEEAQEKATAVAVVATARAGAPTATQATAAPATGGGGGSLGQTGVLAVILALGFALGGVGLWRRGRRSV